jgi:hypothetical protein
MELQSAVTGSVFTGNIQIGGDIFDENGNEIIKLTATVAAINEIEVKNAASGNNPSINASGNEAHIGLDINPKGVGVVSAGGVALNPAELSQHTRAGQRQIVNGNTTISGTSTLNLSSQAVDTWHDVGPTGSGASIIWTVMDRIPDNGVIMLVDCFHKIVTSGVTAGISNLYVTEGGITVGESDLENRIDVVELVADAAGRSITSYKRLEIPLDSSRVFRFYRTETSLSSINLRFYYRGLMTD